MHADDSTPQRLLAAALELIKTDGLQAISHRTVEERAGVARGSTRYHFGSREALLTAVVGYVAELDHATIAAVAEGVGGDGGLSEADPTLQNVALQQMARAMLADPAQSLARFELYLYAARRPELQDAMVHWRQVFIDFGAVFLGEMGAPQPEAGTRMIAAAIDGLLLHSLSSPHADYETWAAEWIGRMGVEGSQLGGAFGVDVPGPES